ncbi:MAG: hypothetical protein HY978_04955 [Candidatus Liptonbacteria bacterium]|nr:hypothetical protein [Candidatus Liptonbacteria bacterium]
MSLSEDLKRLGLYASEAKVYVFLLQRGLTTPPQIARGTGIARTNCYHILRELKDKGLTMEQLKGKRRAYSARDPKSLLAELDRQREEAESLIPALRALYVTQKHKPSISFFEGWEEVRQLYEQILSAEKIVAIGSTEQLAKVDHKFFSWYQRQMAKRKIIFYDLLTYASGEKTAKEIKAVAGALHEIKLLPPRYQDIPTDIMIWHDNVALISLQEPIFGTLLTSAPLAKTFRALFELLWEKL